MTEAEWLACRDDDTGDMQACLRGKGSPRKLRLFACACCYHIERLLTDERSRRAVDIAEKYAEGLATEQEREAVWLQAHHAADELEEILYTSPEAYSEQSYTAAIAAHWAAILSRTHTDIVESASHAALYAQLAAGVETERSWQARILCDSLGEYATLPVIDPSWRTSTVVALAEAIYADRAFDRLPILADALEDAGCDNPDILAHCRSDGPHVRGCWVVDLILGKS